MRNIRYGFFGEDAGQRQFLDAYLAQLALTEPAVGFEAVPYFGKRFGATNNKTVDRFCADACSEAFVLTNPRLDCLFIGRDVDSYEPVRYTERMESLRSKIPRWYHCTLFMLPVQCIEHWLLYLASNARRDSLERKPNDQTKQLLYADRTKTRDVIVAEILADLTTDRINWLATSSESFRAFHQQVVAFVDRHK